MDAHPLVQFADGLANLVREALGLPRLTPAPAFTMEGGRLMFIVKDTQAPVEYTITPPTVVDAMGVTVPGAHLVYKVASDSPAVVIAPDPADPLKGTVSFADPNKDGTNALASVTVGVFLQDGTTQVGSFGAQFTVTPGDPAAIQGGSIAFAGLTEAPPAAPASPAAPGAAA